MRHRYPSDISRDQFEQIRPLLEIHINSGTDIPSGINRAQFEKWKKDYWKSRSLDFD